jgi:hypothetical protein
MNCCGFWNPIWKANLASCSRCSVQAAVGTEGLKPPLPNELAAPLPT